MLAVSSTLAVSATAKVFYVFLIVGVLLVFAFKFSLIRLALRAIEALLAWPIEARKRSKGE